MYLSSSNLSFFPARVIDKRIRFCTREKQCTLQNQQQFWKSSYYEPFFFISKATRGGRRDGREEGMGGRCEIFFSEYCAFCCATICSCSHCFLFTSYLSTLFGISPLFRLPSFFNLSSLYAGILPIVSLSILNYRIIKAMKKANDMHNRISSSQR